MEPNKSYIVLVVIFSVIDTSFSAIFLNFVNLSPRDAYLNSRVPSVHRGLLLSLSPAQKHEICLDLFSFKFNLLTRLLVALTVSPTHISKQMRVIDQWMNWGDPVHPVGVRPIRTVGGAHTPINEDLFFKCLLRNYPGGLSENEREYHVSSAYHSNLMFDGVVFNKWELPNRVSIRQFILLSPKVAPLDTSNLERQYVTTRRTLKYLAEESPEYFNLIETKDTISTLSIWQTFLLCSSIISSPAHEVDRHQFTMKWRDFKQHAEREEYFKFENLQISFRDEAYDREKWIAKCVYCKTSSEIGDVFSGTTSNLLITPDFNDKNSLYVLTEQFGVISISEYWKNVPILINAHVPATSDPPRYF